MCRRGTIWIATVAAAMIASTGATLADADPAEEYRRLVGLYRSGDRDAARGLLQAGIPPAGFTCRGGEECEAAAVLNLDAAALLLASTRKE